MAHAMVRVKPANAKRVLSFRLLIEKDETRNGVRVVSGYKVDIEGNLVGQSNVDHLQVIVNPREVKELIFDYKYGVLVFPHNATQNKPENI